MMNIETITSITGSEKNQLVGDISFENINEKSISNDFDNLIGRGLEKLNNDIVVSETNMTNYILGKDISTHELMISMARAKQTMHITVEIRNRLSEAYQSITRMQV